MYMIFLPVLIFVIGLIVGSFLNVVILRMNTGRSIVRGRSMCVRCSRPLVWYELIPVFSFLALRGKCRTCKEPISFQYALVELATAIVFVVCYIRIVIGAGFTSASWLAYLFTLVVASLLIVIFVYDMRHKIIPDGAVYPFILLSFLALVWRTSVLDTSLFLELINGALVALPFFLLWYFSKGRAMGFGDVKLALGIGWLVGLSIGYGVFLLAFWIGGIVGLLLLAVNRAYSMKSQIAFGPFLILGLFIAGLWGVTIQSIFPLW